MDSRRDELVREGFNHLAAHGFEGLRLRAVAAGVGIDHSTLHHHFRTKQDLVTAVVQHASRQFWTIMPEHGAPEDRLAEHLSTLVTMMRTRADLFAVLNEVRMRAARDPAMAEAVQRTEAGWREALTGVLAAGVASGAFRPDLDVAATAELIVAVSKGANDAPDRAEAAFAEVRRLVRSING
ncbi:TetR/AcrR family transcriptional regulator [Nonomuraea sp. NPDC050786]|uniref:TetR/AcrR family transcriptional regulator n=1 Tax=Nonomuraea sp. NPDC050786 TaxID=3154840 RepID=UPI00340728FC